jgi:hypothetical protein
VALVLAGGALLPGCGAGDTSFGTALFTSGLFGDNFGSTGNVNPPPPSNEDQGDDQDGGSGGSNEGPICITFENDADDPAKIALYTSTDQNASITDLLGQTPEWLPETNQPCVEEDNLIPPRSFTPVIQDGDMLRYQVECGFANAMLMVVGGESDAVLGGTGDDLSLISIGDAYLCGDNLTVTITQDPSDNSFEIGL